MWCAKWRIKLDQIWYPSTTRLCFQGEKADHIKELVLSMLRPVVLSPPQNNESSNLWNPSDTDPLPFFPDTPDKFEISVTDWTCCDNTAVEALLQLRTSKTSWKPSIISRAYTQEKIIQTDEPADESETKLKNPEDVDLNRTRNFGNQNERNTDFHRVSMLLDFLCEENIKCKRLTERNSILEKEVQDLKAELESLTEIFLQKESPSTEVNDHTSSKDHSEVWQIPTRTVNEKRPPEKSNSLITVNNRFSALQHDVDDKRDNSSLTSDNGSFSIQMENIKLKQKFSI